MNKFQSNAMQSISVLIWGTGKFARCLIKELLPEVNIVAFVESHPVEQNRIFYGCPVIAGDKIKEYDYDYIIMALAAEADVRNEFNLPEDMTLSFSALPEYPRITNRLQAWDYGRVLMPVISVETDGVTFLFNGKDNSMSKSMFLTGETYPKSQMDFCLMMLKRRGVFDSQKKRLFLEIGANVGTTTLYMKKSWGIIGMHWLLSQ